jgi:hypothetical protein
MSGDVTSKGVPLASEQVGNSEFYSMLKGLGFRTCPIKRAWRRLRSPTLWFPMNRSTTVSCFHELVHVEQYRQLGISRFSELYVRGFLNGGSYEAIPLEVSAYTLGGRFESDSRRVFSVEDEVRTWAAGGRF